MTPVVLNDQNARVTLDDAHFPVIVSRWQGPPTLACVDHVVAWWSRVLERARACGQSVVHVVDASDARIPPLAVQRAFSKLEDDVLVLRTWVVVKSKLIRSAVVAVMWLGGGNDRLNMVEDLEVALELGLSDLERVGIGRPKSLVPSRYAFENS